MKSILRIVYPYLLFFYSLVVLFIILLGSHGGFYIENSETQRALLIMIVFITTGVFFLQKTEQGASSNIKVNIFKGLNIVTILLLSYQAILLRPFEFTIYSIIFWGIHLFGLLCGVLLTYQLITKKV